MLKKAGAEQAKPRNDTAKIRGSHEREVGRQEDKLSHPRWHSGTITPSHPAESSSLPYGSALSRGSLQMARPTGLWLATPELSVTRRQLIRSAIMFYFGARETAENQENYKTLQCYFAKNINCEGFFFLTNCSLDGLGFSVH